MKRYIISNNSNNITKENNIMAEMAAFFCRSANKHIPDVLLDINSYRIDHNKNKLIWYGDVTYKSDNEPITISISGNISDDMTFDDFGKLYFRNMIESYWGQIELIYRRKFNANI